MYLPIHGFSPAMITSPFGMRKHPITGKDQMHWGIDIKATKGTPVYAYEKGTVYISKMQSNGKGYGEYIVIQHPGCLTLYAHLNERRVKKGQAVLAGQLIGFVGSTGDSTGPHLHFGICLEWNILDSNKSKWRNPITYLFKEEEELIKTINVFFNGRAVAVSAINKDGSNFVRLRDLEDKLGLASVGYDSDRKMPIINSADEDARSIYISADGQKKVVSAILKDGNNYIRLRDLDEKLDLVTVGYDEGEKLPIVNRR